MRLIDADALNIDREHFDTYADYSCAFDMIDEAPTIDVMPVRHGKWIKGTKEMLREYGYYERSDIKFCSECKHEAYWDTDYGQQLFDYCPYCGERMDAERKEE